MGCVCRCLRHLELEPWGAAQRCSGCLRMSSSSAVVRKCHRCVHVCAFDSLKHNIGVSVCIIVHPGVPNRNVIVSHCSGDY